MAEQTDFDMVVIGAGPAGISAAVEASAAGVPASRIVVLEKGAQHSYAIRRFYPDNKRVDAVYKGLHVPCEGRLCIADGSKQETLDYLDNVIRESKLQVRYDEGVETLVRLPGGGFEVKTPKGAYVTKVVVVAIGILGKPNQPDYKLPRGVLRGRVHFDVTSATLEGEKALVVGGGDSAADFVHYLVQKGFAVDLSYRGAQLKRMNPISLAEIEGLQRNGRLTFLMPSDLAAIEVDGGRPRAVFKQPELLPRTYDHVVYALGGSTPAGFLHASGIELEGGEPKLGEGGATSVPGLFLAGDLTAGGKGGSIITAFNSGVAAMRVICRDFLDCEVTPPPQRGDSLDEFAARVPRALGLLDRG